MSSPNAGWYDDGSGTIRWWDGDGWTERTQEPPKQGGLGGLVNRIEAAANSGGQPRPAPSPAVGGPGSGAVAGAGVAGAGAAPGPQGTPGAAQQGAPGAGAAHQGAAPGHPAPQPGHPGAGHVGRPVGGMSYVVLQVVLKEKFWGTGSGNLPELENAINQQAALGYRLHTISTSASGSKGFGGGDRIQATLVFEKLP